MLYPALEAGEPDLLIDDIQEPCFVFRRYIGRETLQTVNHSTSRKLVAVRYNAATCFAVTQTPLYANDCRNVSRGDCPLTGRNRDTASGCTDHSWSCDGRCTP